MTTMASEPQPPGGAPRIEHGDEAALVARALAGDRAAFGVLAERYAAPARRVARAVLDDPDDADDAAQDALLAALVKLQQYDPRRPFGPWLMRIVANAATALRRRRTVRRAEPLDPNATAGGPRPDVRTEQRALAPPPRGALAELAARRRVPVVPFPRGGYTPPRVPRSP